MKKIEVDLEVYKLIESLRTSLEESHRDILLRSLKSIESSENKAQELVKSENPANGSFISDDQELKNLLIKQPMKAENSVPFHTNYEEAHKDWIYNDIRLPEGTPLVKWVNGEKIEAKIENGGISVDGNAYHSPSAAAMAVNGGKIVNGWIFWKYYDVERGKWRKLNFLRNQEFSTVNT